MSSSEDIDLMSQTVPLLISQPNALSKHEIESIIKAIIKNEKLILNPYDNGNVADGDDVTNFLSPFVALSAHTIMSHASEMPKSLLSVASSACNLIIQYLLQLIGSCDENTILSKYQLMSIIQLLCEDDPTMVKSDITLFCTMLKNAKVPSSFVSKGQRVNSKPMGETTVSGATADRIDESTAKEPKRMRLDHSCEAIIEQLMTPIIEHPTKRDHSDHNDKNIVPSIGFGYYEHNTKSLLINKNIVNLQQLSGANTLIEFIQSLPSIESYVQLVHAIEEGAPLKLPNNINDAAAVIKCCKTLMKDFEIIRRILSLPILEPLTEDRLSKVIIIIHSCLYISLTLTCSNILVTGGASPSVKGAASSATITSVDDQDNDTAIVAKIMSISLEMYNKLMMVMKSSIRVGGHVCQNVHLFASWLLLSGLKYIMKTSTGTSLSVPLIKEQGKKQGYNHLCISLALHAVQIITSLFDDLKSEISIGTFQRLTTAEKLIAHHTSISSFKYNKFGYYSAWQRIEMLMSNVNLTHLLFSLASVSYRKAGILKLVSRSGSCDPEVPSGGGSVSGSSGRDNDEESYFSSDDSSRDDDSEPILGQLFKEQEETRDVSDKTTKTNRQILETICSDKREPHRHLTLSMNIFELLNNYFICSEIESLRHYFKLTIGETQITILSHIIKDLDRESGFNYSFYAEFGRSLNSFMHNLIATEVLSDHLQWSLLASLGVRPDSSPDALWPLNVPIRTLSVLSQIILLKQQKEKDELRSDCGTSCIAIWNSLMNHLKKLITSDNLTDLEDINVEHAQLLLFLFHNLKLLQRKTALLMVCQTIVEVSPIVLNPMKDYQIHYLGRLLHLFEYILKNLYDAPSSLIEHISNNLFKSPSTGMTPRRDKDNNNITVLGSGNKSYFCAREIEENYNKYSSDKTFSCVIKPRFYYLYNVDAVNLKDVPKLDGMALNFILIGSNDTLTYNDVYDSLVLLLNVGSQCDLNYRNLKDAKRLGNFGLFTTQYCFNVIWRLILQLPPSIKILELFASGDISQFDNSRSLLATVWIPRVAHNKWFYIWLKDLLSKLLQSNAALKPESMLKSVTQNSGSVFMIELLKHLMLKQLSNVNHSDINQIPSDGMPLMFDMIVIDSLISRVMMLLDLSNNLSDSPSSGSSTLSPSLMDLAKLKRTAVELLPIVLNLISLNLSCVRWSLIHQMCADDAQIGIVSVPKLLNAFNSFLKITSIKSSCKLSNFTSTLSDYLPRNLLKILDKWNKIPIDSAHVRSDHSNSPPLSDSSILLIQSNHFTSMTSSLSHGSGVTQFTSNTSLKLVINSLLKFAEELFQWTDNKYSDEYINVMLPLQLDSTCESFANYGLSHFDHAFGSKDSDNYLTSLYNEALTHAYDLLINYSDKECCVDERILIECVKFMDSLLDTNAGQSALERFFCDDDTKDIVSLLMSASNETLSSVYSTRVLKFFSKLFQQTEKNPDTVSLVRLCTSLSKLSQLSHRDPNILQIWLSKVLCERPDAGQLSSTTANQENRILLQSLTSYIVKENSAVDEDVAFVFLKALIPMGTQILSSTPEVLGFSELMMIMTTLAGAGSGNGHLHLMKSVIEWLHMCKKYLSQKDVIEKLEDNISLGRHQVIMESTCFMLSYLADIFEAIELLNDNIGRSSSPDGDTSDRALSGEDSDWIDELACHDDDESLAEESDEESLCNKLCTFTMTQKEFMNQHWYHCHTCKMIDGVGVCTICAKVCHKDHDITYSKYGSFFCDCGAKEDGSCQAMTRRSANIDAHDQSREQFSVSHDSILPSNLRRRQSPTMDKSMSQSQDNQLDSGRTKVHLLAKQLETSKDEMINLIIDNKLSWNVLSLLQYLTPVMINSCLKNSSIGCSIRAKKALQELHSLDKSIETSDQLMVPTLGSQEGAFENVRMSYTGEQGQQIRQLISNHVIRRVAMCALTGPYPQGKRQHLAVSHEKGKITLLQFATLLKQADSSKKKLTLTRLASAPLPFTTISICGNPCNEDYLAVCGLKDCHVLTFSPTGMVSGHLVLHPQLEAGNYIIKSLWVPGQQTQLALITADFVKIYDLSIDVMTPQYFFILPSGKIRDVTFVFTNDGQRYVLAISSAGHIYCQSMCDESSALNGPFYVTTILDIRHDEVVEHNGLINGGGVSIYYSHVFEMLFYSYSNGKNFMAPIPLEMPQELYLMFPIEVNSSSIASNGSASSNGSSTPKIMSSSMTQQSLCQWTEISGHPGLILAMCLTTNNPIVLMIKPDSIVIQEIKFLNMKAKITDMVALRHTTGNNELRTTMILLCEDGSLRIYMASQEPTNYWLRPTLHSQTLPLSLTLSKTSRRKAKSSKHFRSISSASTNSGTAVSVQFPVDFFEHCILLTDIDFGGADILQVYNVQQVKNRLHTPGMYIASTKPVGFNIDVINNETAMVIVGVRVMLGAQEINRAPSYIEMFGRCIQIALTTNRWFDIPLTREESILSDKKVTIFFAASADPNGVTMVDSIKVYGKSKEAFGWPDDAVADADYLTSANTAVNALSATQSATFGTSSSAVTFGNESEKYQKPMQTLTPLDRLLLRSIGVLDGCLNLRPVSETTDDGQLHREISLGIATQLLTLPYPPIVQHNIKSLLLTLHANRHNYNTHRDATMINYIVESLRDAAKNDALDGEAFFRLITITQQIASERPFNLIQFSEYHNLCDTDSNASNSAFDTEESAERYIELTTFGQQSSVMRLPTDVSMDISTSHSLADIIETDRSQLDVPRVPQRSSSVTFSDEVAVCNINMNSSEHQTIKFSASFIMFLSDTFWKLYNLRPQNPLLTSIASGGLVHVDETVQSLVEIIHAFALSNISNVEIACQLYLKLLLCEDTIISFGAKQSLIRVLRPRSRKRRVYIPSPPQCETPGHDQDQKRSMDFSLTERNETAERSQLMSAQESLEVFQHENLLMPMAQDLAEQQFEIIEGNDHEATGGIVVGPDESFGQLLDADADDDAMVELAIALSLQDQQHRQPPSGARREVTVRSVPMPSESATPQRSASLEDRGHYSDTTASAAASDDEGSTAATDGSTLRTSPAAELHGNINEGGSESGGSGAESIIGEGGPSGRSSCAYGEDLISSAHQSRSHHQMLMANADVDKEDNSQNVRLHELRLALLQQLIGSLQKVRNVGGVRSIPLMQVILVLTSDLDGEGVRDKQVLLSLLDTLLSELYHNTDDISLLVQRSPLNESKLIIMRLLSILMSRVRSGSSMPAKVAALSDMIGENSTTFCSTITATTLMSSTILDFCLQILIHLLSYWKNWQIEDAPPSVSAASSAPTTTSSTPLRPHLLTPPPEMSPFFLKQYVRGHAEDVFESYPQLLTEMILRMPYQIKKISNALSGGSKDVTANFTPVWCEYLCEYMMTNLTPYIRKQVRKLLSYICGSKERYRQLRDFHALESHMKEIKKICRSGGFQDYHPMTSLSLNNVIVLPYDSTISLIEHLKSCCEIASNRHMNWQRFCQKDPSILPFFINVSCLLDDGVSPIVLQLLQCALCPRPAQSSNPTALTSSKPTTSVKLSVPYVEESEEPLYVNLAQQLLKHVDNKLLCQFCQCFLLESNSTNHRWAAHSLIYNLYKSFIPHQQELLLDILWSLWSKLPAYGRKAAQFVDLLGYFTLKINCNDDKEREFTEKALTLLRQQNQNLIHHPNCNLYNSLQSLVEFDGYYLESEPCLVCNNPEVNYVNTKLSSIKVDSRFTTTTQIVKLVGSHTISKITLRISDIKRSKMVKTLNIFYNNRAVHSVVELKNKSAVWHKVRRCNLAAGQSELKIEFLLPIVACNLMIEYSEFYENIQASSETLQCPRCSASVPSNPGVCSNCGENVFQCHKCRAINYDEKDPFLCNSCGFCKYAKFDYTLIAKPTCAVDPIENEDDRKKTVSAINALLEKADRVYKSLIANKPALEMLLLRIQEHGMIDKFDDTTLGVSPNMVNVPGAASTIHVNRAIQQVAQRYCSDCKSSFDELSKIIQKVLASRKELVDYDNRQKEKSSMSKTSSIRRDSKTLASSSLSSSVGCYGCASATVEHSITLLKALAIVPKYRTLLCSYGLIRELVDYNLRNGSTTVRHEVRQLLCSLTRDNHRATNDLNNLLMDKISVALKSRSGASLELSSSVRHEIALLACSMEKEDACWEQRLRCVIQLFLMGLQIDSPAVLELITLPCLKLLQSLIKPEPAISKKNKDKSIEQLSTVRSSGFQVAVDLNKWLSGDPKHSFKAWKMRSAKKQISQSGGNHLESESKFKSKTKAEIRVQYLVEKYSQRWREKCQKHQRVSLTLLHSSWLRTILFNGASRSVRLMACSLIEALFQVPSRKREIIDLLISYLDDLGSAGEFGTEFFNFYHSIIQEGQWKYYLSLRGILPHIGNLITKEIDILNQMEETTLNSDLSQGCALKFLVELLTSLMDVDTIRRQYKSRMVGFVLNGYLSLRKLVVQRTKVIDETQESLLELLEEMTSGTESETAAFMRVCLDAVNKGKMDDLRTPVFIFERLCSIIYPEENDTSEFFITLEKDPQQDDFLQGRMLGNPYSSNEPGMGPLMRDIKNKICQDCELVALLEDDSGLELLVNNKIISLDLPVKDVYRKIWIGTDSHGHQTDTTDAMRIIYRIRGLMGDATEEFIESLDSKDNKEVDNEQVYKMANVMSQCGGIEVMLSRLEMVTDLSPQSRQLVMVLLKLFGHCVKVRSNRQRLIDPSLKTITVMIKILKLILKSEAADLISLPSAPGHGSPLEQLLQIMEVILVEASACTVHEYDEFCTMTCGTANDISSLLSMTASSPIIKTHANLMQMLMRVVPFLTLGNEQKMETLLNFFKPYLLFNKLDFEHTAEDDHYLELFCQLVTGIEHNENGNRLKELIDEDGIVQTAIEYLVLQAPPLKSSLLATSEEWKEFTSRPALKYVLRILTGLSAGHDNTQLMVSRECIPIIHGLEQVASDAHVGSLAENLMEVIKQHPSVEEKIEDVRRTTRDEKKRLAMAVREKQLAGLGMRTNDKGQVTAKSALLKQVEDLGDESGLVCIICREGYKFQPSKVLGIYTFTKRCNVDDGEIKTRKTLGYTTVTHFNVVHVDCHMAAVRHARGRDEWESAALQNANTRCNGLLPLWGPSVQESAFASCLARHNTYLQECTGHRDVSYTSTIHDLKLLILRFASEKKFSDDSGGGGPQSNMHLVPYMIHMALYVINTTRSAARESKKICNFLEMPSNKWIDNCFEAEGPFYWSLMSLMVHSPSVWIKNRLNYLRRLIILSHVRHEYSHSSTVSNQASAAPSPPPSIVDTNPGEYNIYKTSLIYFSFVDCLYNNMFKNALSSDDHHDWPLVLAEYIRNNDQLLMDSGVKLLRFYNDDLVPCQSFEEFCDVMSLQSEITDPQQFISSALRFG